MWVREKFVTRIPRTSRSAQLTQIGPSQDGGLSEAAHARVVAIMAPRITFSPRIGRASGRNIRSLKAGNVRHLKATVGRYRSPWRDRGAEAANIAQARTGT